MKPKVTFIIDNLTVAGAQMHLFNLVCGLRDVGYPNLEVITLGRPGEIEDWLAQAGIAVSRFGMQSVRKPGFWLELARLVGHLWRTSPEVVHTYLDTANVFGVVAAKCAGVRRIMTSRRDLGVFRSRRMEVIIGRLSNQVDKVVCVCEAAAKESLVRERLHGRNVKVIHNGIDIRRFACVARLSGEELLFANVAVANRKEKGQEDLVRAFALLAPSLPEARLRLIGDGPLLPALKELARQLGVSDRIEFYGNALDIPAALRDVRVFVLPSHSEGISNALLEAMALGIPAVATRVGGNPDVVVEGESGILVEPRNPEALAQGMLAIGSDRGRLDRMGEAAAARVRSAFVLEQMICNFDRLYVGGL